MLYPGMRVIANSSDAAQWSSDIGIAFYEASVQCNGHNLSLIFSGLTIQKVNAGYAPFTVTDDSPDLEIPPT